MPDRLFFVRALIAPKDDTHIITQIASSARNSTRQNVGTVTSGRAALRAIRATSNRLELPTVCLSVKGGKTKGERMTDRFAAGTADKR